MPGRVEPLLIRFRWSTKEKKINKMIREAQSARLFVPGWTSSRDYRTQLDGDGCILACAMVYDGDLPVGICYTVDRGSLWGIWISVFVKTSHRKRGLAKRLIRRVQSIDASDEYSAGYATEHSRILFEDMGIENIYYWTEYNI